MMKRSLFRALLTVFIVLLPVSQVYSARVLILLAAVTPFLSPGFSLQKGLRQGWEVILYLLILVMGLLYSTDVEMGARQLETSLSLLGMVWIFGFFDQAVDFKRDLFYPMAAGLILASFICFASALQSFLITNDIQVFFFDQFTDVIDSHPIYFSYYIIFGITVSVFLLHYEQGASQVLVLLIAFFFIVLLLLGGQTIFISLLLIVSFFLLRFLLGEKTKRDLLLACGLVGMLVIMFSFVSLAQFQSEFSEVRSQNDYWERIQLWISALKANESFWLGVGTGDYNLVLVEYFRENGLTTFANRAFNSHNQFVQVLFTNGVLGLVGLVMMLGRPLYLFMKAQNQLAILVMFPFLVYGITEVFLGRYQGVAFFALVQQFLLNGHYKDRSANLRQLNGLDAV